MLVIRDVCPLCNTRCKKPSHYPRHVSRSCAAKVAHAELMDAVNRALMDQHINGDTRHVYLCPLDDHWHVSRTRRFLKRRKRSA